MCVLKTGSIMLVVAQAAYIGKLVLLTPGYGWGWRRADDEQATLDFEPILQAGSCHMRVQRFFSWRGEVRGLVCRVEQSGHIFDDLYVVCGEMLAGEHDFVYNLCHRYDLEIGPNDPGSTDDWPRIVDGEPNYCGYGIVAESNAVIADWVARTSVKHKRD